MTQIIEQATLVLSWPTPSEAASARVCGASVAGVALFDFDDDDSEVVISAAAVTLTVDSTGWDAGLYQVQCEYVIAGITRIEQTTVRVVPNICPEVAP